MVLLSQHLVARQKLLRVFLRFHPLRISTHHVRIRVVMILFIRAPLPYNFHLVPMQRHPHLHTLNNTFRALPTNPQQQHRLAGLAPSTSDQHWTCHMCQLAGDCTRGFGCFRVLITFVWIGQE